MLLIAALLCCGAMAAEKESSILDVLEGKKILFVGDSLTAGYGLDSTLESWPMLLERDYGMEVDSISVSGSTMSFGRWYGHVPGGCYAPIATRPLPEGDYDIIFVDGGGNDWYCEIPLGSPWYSDDCKSYTGGLNVLIDRLEWKYPDALIVCMTVWESPGRLNYHGDTTDDYVEAMAALCAARGIPCYMANDSEENGIYMADPEFREEYCLSDTDAWHLNAAGQRLFLPVIAGWLSNEWATAQIRNQTQEESAWRT